MLKTRQIPVGTTPVVIASATVAANDTAAMSLAGATLFDAVPIIIWSPTTVAVYLGGSSLSTVSTNLGIPLIGPAFGPTYNLLASDALWAYTTGSTNTLTVQAGRQS